MALTTSVVLCTFNGARFLEAQWGSLLAQTRLPDEIVVRDDASIDATPALLAVLQRRAAAAGVRVRLSRNADNVGYVANFESALRDASGDVLLLCDQDDVWHADKVASLLGVFERRDTLQLLCSDAQRIDAVGAPLPGALFDVLKVSAAERRTIHAGGGFGVLLRRSLATGATIALRRQLLSLALPIPAGWVHDEWLAIVAAARDGFDCVEARLIDYRQHAGNQLGMADRSGAAKLSGLLLPGAVMLDAAIARNAALQARLDALGAQVPEAHRRQADDQLHHLHARQRIVAARWTRPARILRELWRGGYGRYAAGWHDALRDLLRRG
ncbi:MAG TPA: glycosyltransferase family 2 protein [Rhodanobacteraceae bacterium]